MDVVCVGDCGIDHYLPSGERMFGGITANFARHARREFSAGDTIHIVSCVGDDDGGEFVRRGLENSGIECHVSMLHGSTPVQYIEVADDGERRFVRYDEGVLRDFRFTVEQARLIAASDLLVAPVYLQIVGLFDELLSTPASGRVAIDFADFGQHPEFSLLDKHLRDIDIAFFGLTAHDPAIAELQRLADMHEKLFIVTLGPDGSVAFDGSARFDCPASPVVRVVDTTGAGDAYAAAFLARYCHGADIPDAMEHAASLAAKIIGQIGTYRR